MRIQAHPSPKKHRQPDQSLALNTRSRQAYLPSTNNISATQLGHGSFTLSHDTQATGPPRCADPRTFSQGLVHVNPSTRSRSSVKGLDLLRQRRIFLSATFSKPASVTPPLSGLCFSLQSSLRPLSTFRAFHSTLPL